MQHVPNAHQAGAGGHPGRHRRGDGVGRAVQRGGPGVWPAGGAGYHHVPGAGEARHEGQGGPGVGWTGQTSGGHRILGTYIAGRNEIFRFRDYEWNKGPRR